MLFTVAATAFLSFASFVRAVDTNRASCDAQGPWIAPTFTGADWPATPDYQKFCEAGYTDGDVLTGIKIWKASWQIHALQFRWGSHDYGKVYGEVNNINEPDEKVEWDASTKVTIRLWNNKPDDGDPIDAVGRIRISIEGKDDVEVGAKHVGKEVQYSTGAGMILAVSGASGAWISTLQLHYLESTIVDASMSSITFDDSVDKYNDGKKGMEPAVIGNIYIKNSNPAGGPNQTFSMAPILTRQSSKTVTTSMSHSVGTTFGFKVSTEVGLPELASVTVEASTEIRYDFQYLKSEGTTETETWSYTWSIGSLPGGLPPQTAAHCTATATMGTFSSDYHAKMTAVLDNGKTFTYNDVGNYKSIGYADGTSDCRNIPLSEVPDGKGQEASDLNPNDVKIRSLFDARRAIAFKA